MHKMVPFIPGCAFEGSSEWAGTFLKIDKKERSGSVGRQDCYAEKKIPRSWLPLTLQADCWNFNVESWIQLEKLPLESLWMHTVFQEQLTPFEKNNVLHYCLDFARMLQRYTSYNTKTQVKWCFSHQWAPLCYKNLISLFKKQPAEWF